MSKKNNKEHDHSNNKIEKIIENEEVSYVLNVKEDFLNEGEFSPEVKEVLDDVFTEMVEEDQSEETTEKLSNNALSDNKKETKLGINENGGKNLRKKSEISIESDEEELETLYENKLSELKEKIDDYNTRYQKLEETIQKYEDGDKKLVEKRIEYEDSI
ncbi:MAG: hypothetical protein ACFFDH_25520, partial [Promethearchaeota archaeon]